MRTIHIPKETRRVLTNISFDFKIFFARIMSMFVKYCSVYINSFFVVILTFTAMCEGKYSKIYESFLLVTFINTLIY